MTNEQHKHQLNEALKQLFGPEEVVKRMHNREQPDNDMRVNDSPNTVTVAIIAHDTHVLLLQRNPDEYPDHGDKWELIGEHIKTGELAVWAAHRGILEETGLTDLILQMVTVQSFINCHNEGAWNWVYVAFVDQELPVRRSNEHIADQWVPISEALQMKLACRHNAILKDIVARFL